LDQPAPAVNLDGDNTATVWLVVNGVRTPEWRADFNARARSERVPVEAWWIEGKTVLQVAVDYRTPSRCCLLGPDTAPTARPRISKRNKP
jgi:hypothetical protein